MASSATGVSEPGSAQLAAAGRSRGLVNREPFARRGETGFTPPAHGFVGVWRYRTLAVAKAPAEHMTSGGTLAKADSVPTDPECPTRRHGHARLKTGGPVPSATNSSARNTITWFRCGHQRTAPSNPPAWFVKNASRRCGVGETYPRGPGRSTSTDFRQTRKDDLQ